jgi:hypothetical protein
MSLESWWRSLAKERTKRVQSRTQRTLARQEASARTAEAKYGRKKPQIIQDTGQVVMEEEPSGMSGYLLPALVLGGLLLMRQSKEKP